MSPVSDEMILPAAIFGLFAVGGGAYLAFFARHYRDWTIRQLQKSWMVPYFRCLGVFFLVAGLFGAWMIATKP